ncbi:MAG: hypothetical protein JSR60_03940 [Proteobacteria bacterium]|nr:hypothetical protein [Pseudomonadota bacterium]
MRSKALLVGVGMLALAGCTTSTPYRPATDDRSSGYTDMRLADNRYRVTFTGNSATKRETVENFLLLRAAEVTRDAGYQWFTFDTRSTEAKTTYHTDFDGYPGWGPRFGWYWHNWRYSPWDPYWAHGDVEIPTTRYQAYAEIIVLTPDQAKNDPHALNASDVIGRLGPQAAPPPKN